MTYHQKFTTETCPKLNQVRWFLRDHGAALAKAVYKIGGPTASARAFLLREAVRHTRRLTRAQSNQLVDFHQLLMQRRVIGAEHFTGGFSVELKPSYKGVDERCLLSEQLRAVLSSTAENDMTSDPCCKASRMIFKAL
tara:strand:- start:1653 stop:2066 length:414 start_codon:yes stop_codon:yes gene_type:complete